MTTGARRHEICALRWSDMLEVTLDPETITVLAEHRARITADLSLIGADLAENVAQRLDR